MRKTVRLIVLEKFNNLQYEQGENDFKKKIQTY